METNNTWKARQARLCWYGHILRSAEGNKVKQMMKMVLRGTQAILRKTTVDTLGTVFLPSVATGYNR